jgi:Cu(I)/Ag(I) efflux system membrane fusion protein
VWLIFNVFESDISKIAKGDKITFTTTSIPGKEFKANVTYINPLLNVQSRTATIRAELNTRNNQLKPGMLLNGKIEVRTQNLKGKENTNIKIPNSAILWTGDLSVVYVQIPDTEVPSFEFREVKILTRSADFSTISGGVELGEKVVTNGAFAIDASAQLNNNMSMMNRNVAIKKDGSSDIIPSYIDETPDEFRTQLDDMVISYLDLKNTLVNTDANGASLSADLLLKSLENVDMSLLKGDGHVFWMDQLNAIKSHGENIKNSSDVEKQRDQFDFLSQGVINSLKAFGTNEKTYYVQYCPMAKGNQGADWLSTENVIKNPYFGDKMMKCGSIKLELN